MIGAATSARWRRVIGTYARVTGPHLRLHRRALIGILVLSGLGALAQGGAIGFIGFAVDALETDKVGAWGLPGGLPTALVLFGAALLAMLLVGAACVYVAVIRIRALARAFSEDRASDTLDGFRARTTLDHGTMPATIGELQRLLVRDSIHLGRAIESIVRLADPACRLVVALVVLFLIDVKLSLIVMPLLVVFFPIAARLGATIRADSGQFFEKTAVGMYRGIGMVGRGLNLSNVGAAPDGRAIIRGGADFRAYFDEFDRIQLAQARVDFTSSLIASSLLVGSLLVGGSLAAAGTMSWAYVLAYLMGLRQLMLAVQHVMSTVASLSMFYPAAERIVAFDAGRIDPEGGAELPVVVTSERTLDGDAETELARGSVVFLRTERAVERLTLGAILGPLFGSLAPVWAQHTGFAGYRAHLHAGTLRTALALGEDDDEAADAAWAELGVTDALAAQGGLDSELDADDWAALDPALRAALLTVALERSGHPVVVMDARLGVDLGADVMDALRGRFRDRVLIFVAHAGWLAPPADAQVIVVTEGRVAGLGDVEWYRSVRDTLAAGDDASTTDSPEDLELAI